VGVHSIISRADVSDGFELEKMGVAINKTQSLEKRPHCAIYLHTYSAKGILDWAKVR